MFVGDWWNAFGNCIDCELFVLLFCFVVTVARPPHGAGYIEDISPTSSHKENSSSLINQIANLPGFNPLKARLVKQYSKTSLEDILPTAVEKSLPWRRDRSSYNFGTSSMYVRPSVRCILPGVRIALPLNYKQTNNLANVIIVPSIVCSFSICFLF